MAAARAHAAQRRRLRGDRLRVARGGRPGRHQPLLLELRARSRLDRPGSPAVACGDIIESLCFSGNYSDLKVAN